MIKTPEQIEFEEAVGDIVRQLLSPLKKEIADVRTDLIKNDRDHHDKVIQDILAKTSLAVRFKVFLEMQYLNATIAPFTCCTHEEMKEADEWAKDTTSYLLNILRTWEDDGRPSIGDEDLE